MTQITPKTYALRALSLGFLISIAVFGTRYSVGGILIYPGLLFSFFGFLLVLRSRRLFRFISPISAIIPVILLIFAVAAMHEEWRHLLLVLSLVIRGVVIPYFSAILLLQLISDSLQKISIENHWRFIILIVFSAVSIQAGLAVFQLLNYEFRISFINLVNLEEGWRDMATLGLPRFTGIGGISIYDTALSYCLFAAIFLVNRRCRSDGPWLSAALIALLIFLCVLHGRTALLFMVVFVVIVAMQEILMFRRNPYLIFRVFVLIIGGALVLYAYIPPDDIDYILGTAGELLINYFAGEGFRSDSTDDLLQNYLIWPSYQAVVVGSGVWAQPDLANPLGYNYSTDSGYLLLLNFGGALFLFLFILSLIFIIFNYCKASSKVQGNVFNNNFLIFISYVSSIIVISSVKGPLFLSGHFMTALFLMLGVTYRFASHKMMR